jgi:predicted ATPase with chaperone activity
MLSTVYSAGLFGIDGFPVTVEVDARPNLPSFELVGLPDMAVKEAKERVRTACENSGLRFPETSLMVNLAPADRRKEGSGFDLAILTAFCMPSAPSTATQGLTIAVLSESYRCQASCGAFAVCFACVPRRGMRDSKRSTFPVTTPPRLPPCAVLRSTPWAACAS